MFCSNAPTKQEVEVISPPTASHGGQTTTPPSPSKPVGAPLVGKPPPNVNKISLNTPPTSTATTTLAPPTIPTTTTMPHAPISTPSHAPVPIPIQTPTPTPVVPSYTPTPIIVPPPLVEQIVTADFPSVGNYEEIEDNSSGIERCKRPITTFTTINTLYAQPKPLYILNTIFCITRD